MSYTDGLKLFPHLIAYANGVNANSAADTTLTFVNGGNLSEHIPFDVVVEWGSGTFTAAVIGIKANGSTVVGGIALSGLANTNRYAFDLKGQLIDNSGNIAVSVTTPNGSASTFDIKVYGISL